MKTKTIRGGIQLKEPKGSFRAIFSRFNVIDKDQDVTLPGAFTEGEKVRISYWGHRWQDLPVGRGTIHSDLTKGVAYVDGQFFLDTEGGRETYNVVKGLSELQEWSYGFDVLDSEQGTFKGERVQFLKKLKVFEVSPVMLGAGIGTHTDFVKNAPFSRRYTVADVKRQVDALGPGSSDTPSYLKRRIEQAIEAEADAQLEKEFAALTSLLNAKSGGSRLDTYRQSLIADGMSPPLAAAWAGAEVTALEQQIAYQNPLATADWIRREAISYWQRPTR